MRKTKFLELKEVFETLHGPRGCVWDKEQTHESLIEGLQEETGELIRAIKNGDVDNMKEELGDVLLHVMFQAQIASKNKEFDIEEVIDVLIKKMKYRHPHVFGAARVGSSAEVVRNWKRLKKEEKEKKSTLDNNIK